MKRSDYLQPGDLCKVTATCPEDPPRAQVYNDHTSWEPKTTIGSLAEDENIIFLELWVGQHQAAKIMCRFGVAWMRWDRLVRLNVR